ncbi:phage protein Gp36 family protein [Yersinia enterocolitica]|uniref:phage protein Gp36 family protein n=1 Tax=Yersinia enterocolitica TaxID=630 RepID=UPI003CFE8E3A
MVNTIPLRSTASYCWQARPLIAFPISSCATCSVRKSNVGKCCDIARFLLCGAETQNTDEIRERYEDARRYFEKVAAGTITLGKLPNGEVIESTPRIRFSSAGRNFGRDSTNGGAF